jgi:hypothetical protein
MASLPWPQKGRLLSLLAGYTANASLPRHSCRPATGSGANFVVADGIVATYSRAAGESVAGGPYRITATLSAIVANALDNLRLIVPLLAAVDRTAAGSLMTRRLPSSSMANSPRNVSE